MPGLPGLADHRRDRCSRRWPSAAVWAGIAGSAQGRRAASARSSRRSCSTTSPRSIVVVPASSIGRRCGVERQQLLANTRADPGQSGRTSPAISVDEIIATRRAASTASSSSPSLVGMAYWFVLGKHPVRLRPADDRANRDRRAVASGVKVKRMVLTSMLHLRQGRGPGRHAAALRRRTTPTATPSRPASGSPASPSRCSAATAPSASSSRRCCWAYLDAQGNGLADQRRRLRPPRPGHPGRHRPLGRHRLRAGPAGRCPDGAAAGRLAARGHSNAVARDGRRSGMSDQGLVITTGLEAPPPPRRPIHRARWFWFAVIGGAIVVLSTVRVITGAEDIDSSGALTAAIALAMPIGLAGLGGLWCERAGVVNIGLEGMMILGTWGGAFFAYYYGPWVGILGAVLLGIVGGAVHALATVIFGVDHIVSGVAINLLGAGAGAYLACARRSAACPAAARPSRRRCRSCRSSAFPVLSDWLGPGRGDRGGGWSPTSPACSGRSRRTSTSSASSPSCC